MKSIIASTIIAIALIAGALILGGGSTSKEPSRDNVTVVGDTQIVSIGVRGGYSPRATLAKADIATVFRLTTQNTFDCSLAMTIPALGYRKNLPSSGVTDIPVPPQKSGTTLQGVCAMGMYAFEIQFN